ncbi:MAG: hypothetical protein NTW19_19730 [Planctomycetota bacterium]|nr:hypothetical protein [Planctomycetota bacterium]
MATVSWLLAILVTILLIRSIQNSGSHGGQFELAYVHVSSNSSLSIESGLGAIYFKWGRANSYGFNAPFGLGHYSEFGQFELFPFGFEFNESRWVIGFADWALLLIFLILPFRWVSQCWHQPYQPGICHKCGYDLRASKNTCPECGEPIPAKDAKISKNP